MLSKIMLTFVLMLASVAIASEEVKEQRQMASKGVFAKEGWKSLPTGTVQRIALGYCSKQYNYQTNRNNIVE